MVSYEEFLKFLIRDYLIMNFGFGKLSPHSKEEIKIMFQKFKKKIPLIEKQIHDIINGKCLISNRNKLVTCIFQVLSENTDSLTGNAQVTYNRLIEMENSTPHTSSNLSTWIDYGIRRRLKTCDSCKKNSNCVKDCTDSSFGFFKLCCCCSVLNSKSWRYKNNLKYCEPELHTKQTVFV